MIPLAFLVFALLSLAGLGYRFIQRGSVDAVNAAEHELTSDALFLLGSHQAISLELATGETRLEELETLFPAKFSGPTTVSRLIRMAESSSLSVSDVQTQPGTAEVVGENIYRRMSIEIQLQGTLSSLRQFLENLEDGAIPASRIDNLIIGNIAPFAQPDGTPDYTLEVGLLLSIFSRDPVSDDEPTSAGGP